jgi:hypothetical protein
MDSKRGTLYLMETDEVKQLFLGPHAMFALDDPWNDKPPKGPKSMDHELFPIVDKQLWFAFPI